MNHVKPVVGFTGLLESNIHLTNEIFFALSIMTFTYIDFIDLRRDSTLLMRAWHCARCSIGWHLYLYQNEAIALTSQSHLSSSDIRSTLRYALQKPSSFHLLCSAQPSLLTNLSQHSLYSVTVAPHDCIYCSLYLLFCNINPVFVTINSNLGLNNLRDKLP